MARLSDAHLVRSHRPRPWLLGGLLLHALLAVSQAQIILDGSLGPRGPLPGPNYRIDAELGQTRGSNLFHSFHQFNVPTGGSASFTGPNTIANIVSRVTGGQPSSIDGVLRSEIGGANLYLLNPSGVMFGPRASLEVSGSFHISTADVLRFTDGATFSASLGQESVLTVAPPAAFGFLGSNPAAIAIKGSSLQVPAGKELSVVGGDINIVGNGGPLTANSISTLGAPDGRLQLASVASPGEVLFSPLDLAPDLQVDSFARLGRIELSQGAFLEASGNGGGTVLLRGGRLRVAGSAIFANNLGNADGSGLGMDLGIAADAIIVNRSFITTDSVGGRARDLRLTAASVHLDESLIGSRTVSGSHGNGGNIEVRVGRLTLTGGARISSSTSGSGHGGALTVVATDTITIAGLGLLDPALRGMSGLFSSTSGQGDAGRLFVSVPLLTMDNGTLSTRALPSSHGNGGNIEVRVGQLTLTGGAQISSSTSGSGHGGTLTVVATDTITIDGRSLSGSSELSSETQGLGLGGNLLLAAPRLHLRDGGTISARSTGDGAAGTLMLDIGETFRNQGGRVATDATKAGGGRIELTAGRLVQLSNSELTTSVQGGGSDAGNLTLEAPFIVLDGSRIVANAFEGKGGNIRLGAEVFLADPASLVDASSTLGIQGTVDIQAPVTSLSEAVAPLPQAFVNVTALLPARCAARAPGGRYSSLVLGGPDGLPLAPSGVLSSPLVLDEWLAADPAAAEAPPRQPSSAKFVLLAGREKDFPRLRGAHQDLGCTR